MNIHLNLNHVDNHHSSMRCNLQRFILFYRVELALFNYSACNWNNFSLGIIIYTANGKHLTLKDLYSMHIWYKDDDDGYSQHEPDATAKELNCSTIWTLHELLLLYTGWMPELLSGHPVWSQAQTTSYQNSWQGLENVQDTDRDRARVASFSSSRSMLPAPSNGATLTFTS